MEPHTRQLRGTAKSPVQNVLGAVIAVVTGSALLVLGFMFSLLILSMVAVAGLLGYGYLWWKTRALRQQIKAQMLKQSQHSRTGGDDTDHTDGVIIEGEVIHDNDKLSR